MRYTNQKVLEKPSCSICIKKLKHNRSLSKKIKRLNCMKNIIHLNIMILISLLSFSSCEDSGTNCLPSEYDIITSPDTLYFTESNNVQTVYLSLKPSGKSNWNITKYPSWIIFDHYSGTIENNIIEVETTAIPDSLTPGLKSGSIEIITDAGGKSSVYAYFSVNEHPLLELNPNELTFPVGTSSAKLTLKNIGTGILNWSLTGNNDTISVSKSSGSILSGNSYYINVSVNKYILLPGTYTIPLQLNSNSENLSSQQILLNIVVESNPLMKISVNTLNFNYFVDTLKFYIQNIGNSNLDWSLSDNSSFLHFDKTSGNLQRGDSSWITVTLDRNNMDDGDFSTQILLFGSANQNYTIDVFVNNFKDKKYILDHNVIDAEFDAINNRVITISSTPNRLNIIDPQNKSIQHVDLPVLPSCVSVSRQGGYATVGSNGYLILVNLTSAAIEKSHPISCNALDIVMALNGWAYVFPTSDQWTTVRCVNLATGVETQHTGNFIYAGTKGKLHPSGKYIYGADNGISPSDFHKFNIQNGTATYVHDSPYHGNYSFGGDLWISEDGLRIFAKSGNIFKSTESSDDLTYNGSLDGMDNLKWVSTSQSDGTIYAIPYIEESYYNYKTAPYVSVFNGTYSTFIKNIYLQPFIVPDGFGGGTIYPSEGQFVFIGNSNSEIFVLVKADNNSGLTKDWALIKIPL